MLDLTVMVNVIIMFRCHNVNPLLSVLIGWENQGEVLKAEARMLLYLHDTLLCPPLFIFTLLFAAVCMRRC